MLYVMYDRPIFSMKYELFSLRGRYRFFFKDSENLTVKVDPLSIISKTYYEVIFLNLLNWKNEQIELVFDFIGSVNGIFYEREKEGAPMICKIMKQYDAKLFLTAKDNYIIEISPNVDAALILGLAVCFDEIKKNLL